MDKMIPTIKHKKVNRTLSNQDLGVTVGCRVTLLENADIEEYIKKRSMFNRKYTKSVFIKEAIEFYMKMRTNPKTQLIILKRDHQKLVDKFRDENKKFTDEIERVEKLINKEGNSDERKTA